MRCKPHSDVVENLSEGSGILQQVEVGLFALPEMLFNQCFIMSCDFFSTISRAGNSCYFHFGNEELKHATLSGLSSLVGAHWPG